MTDTEIIEAMVTFMKNTNEILQRLGIEINNVKVDIEKLKKHQVPRIIVPRSSIVDAVGKEYNGGAGGNGEHKSC